MNMIGLVRNEWKKVFLPVLLTTVLLAIAMSVLSCTIYQNYTLHYDLEAWEVGTELFFSALSAVCCGAAMLEFCITSAKTTSCSMSCRE